MQLHLSLEYLLSHRDINSCLTHSDETEWRDNTTATYSISSMPWRIFSIKEPPTRISASSSEREHLGC